MLDSSHGAPPIPLQLCPIEIDGSVDLGQAVPHPVLPEVIEATVALYQRKGFVRPWIGFVAIDAGHVVGSCGFAAPAERGEAELAYVTFPGHEGQGVATRMAVSLMASAQEAARLQGIGFIAHTLPATGPSTTILGKLGFTLVGSIQHPAFSIRKMVKSGSGSTPQRLDGHEPRFQRERWKRQEPWVCKHA